MNLAALGLFVVLTLVFLMGVVLPAISGRPRRAILARQTLDELGETPSIEVVVPAYLEVSEIEEKVRSLRAASEHCPGGMHITINAGDPETAAAARAADADRVIVGANRGKPAAINEAVGSSTSDIIVLTDANCRIEPMAWPQFLLESLAKFGLVSSNKVERSSNEGLYWLVESRIKKSGGEGQPTLGVVGEFVGFRRVDFETMPETTLVDDLWMALDFASRNRFGTVDTRIWTTEKPGSRREQWERRLRICEGLLTETLPQVMQLLAVSSVGICSCTRCTE